MIRLDDLIFNGEGGIRTRDTVSCIHDFQSCAFSRSATSPALFSFEYPVFGIDALFSGDECRREPTMGHDEAGCVEFDGVSGG